MSRTREFLTLFVVFSAIASLVAWVSTNPPATEQFASISVVGPANNTSTYFPGNNRTVKVNEPISWNVQVYNHMGSSLLFQLIIKLANRTMSGPDPASNTPTNRSAPILFQEYHVVLSNETWSFPVQWSITNRTFTGSSVTIHSMNVNGVPISNIETSASIVDNNNGNNFRVVIELWSYDVQSHGFLFSYLTNRSPSSVFNQVWFNVHT